MIRITMCPTCGSDKIKRVRRNWTEKVQDETYTVPNLEYYECPDCGEKVYDREAMRKIEAHSPAFSKRQVRKKRVGSSEAA
jgi:YgiT-type zinc finger domain-containing protein